MTHEYGFLLVFAPIVAPIVILLIGKSFGWFVKLLKSKLSIGV